MLSPRNNRFGIPGVISVIALVFAMFGGAYAATNSSGGGKATSSAKAKKGPRGPKGPAGPVGPAGPAGSAGAKGDIGPVGANGESVAISAASVGECPVGGAKFTIGTGSGKACNGKNGTNGTNGTTGFTETLPVGKTETGVWALGEISSGGAPQGGIRVPISFDIPLAAGLTGEGCGTNPPAATCHVHYINKANEEVIGVNVSTEAETTVTSTACTGSVAAPTAIPGNLCVYTGDRTHTAIKNSFIHRADEEESGASTAGAVLSFFGIQEGSVGFGTWAVTAEE